MGAFNQFQEHRLITIIGLVQVALIILFWAMATISMKFMGYPDLAFNFFFNPSAVFLRNWGFIFLLIPVAWVFGAIFIDSRADWNVSKRTLLALGLGVTILLFAFLLGTATAVGHRGILILTN